MFPRLLSADQTEGRLHTFLAPSWNFTWTQNPQVLCTGRCCSRSHLRTLPPRERFQVTSALQGEDPSTETQGSGQEQRWDN